MTASTSTASRHGADSASATGRATLTEMADEHSRDAEGLYSAGRDGIRSSVVVLSTRALLIALAAVFLGSIVDRSVSGGPTAVSLLWLSALLLAAAALGVLWPLSSARTSATVESRLRERILRQVVENPAVRYRTGEVTNRATEGAAAVGSLAGRFLPQLIAGVVIPILICAVVATIDVPIALILLISVPAVPLLLRGMENRFTAVTTRYRATADRLTAEFFDGIQGMATLRALGAADRYRNMLAADSERLQHETMALLRVNQLALLAVDSLFTLGTVVAAGVAAAWRVEAGAITVGEAVAIVLLGVALIEPISQIGRFFYVGAIGRAAAKDIKEFFVGPSQMPYLPRVGDEGWVRLEDVSFSYESGPQVLDSVSLKVRPGEVVGLVGVSGAGKTTLAHLIAGLLAPDEGTVHTGGRVAVVAQHPFLFHGTLRENLLLAAPDASDEELYAALEAADLSELVGKDSLDRAVGERGLQLSGGEAQRLTIARMMLAAAPIVVLDEPTSNVDIETERRVKHALARLMAERTVILIAHRRSTLADVDRVIAVGGGKVTETTAASP